jgi:hypothetical protein
MAELCPAKSTTHLSLFIAASALPSARDKTMWQPIEAVTGRETDDREVELSEV